MLYSNKTIKNIIFIFCLFLYSTIFSEGFISGTLIKTNNGYIPIEHLEINDFVVSYDFKEKNLVAGKIIKKFKKHSNKCVKLIVHGNEIITQSDHKFFCPLKKGCWIQAKNIQKNEFILQDVKGLARVDEIIELNQENDFYSLSIDQSHNYFVTEKNIFVHNEPLSVSLCALGAWAVATFEFEFTVTLCGIAAYSYGRYKNNQAALDLGKKALGTGIFVIAAKGGLNTEEARKKAKDWGFKEGIPPFNSHGKPAFKKGNTWITPDRDGHNGGVWKEYKGKIRVGTLDANGEKIGK